MDQIIVMPYVLFEPTDSTPSRDIPDIELTTAFWNIIEEKPKKERIKAISKLFLPWYVIPLDENRGIILSAFEGLLSRIRFSDFSSDINPQEALHAKELDAFVQQLKSFSQQIRFIARGKITRVKIDYLPSEDFLVDMGLFLSHRQTGLDAYLEKMISVEKKIDVSYIQNSDLKRFPSKELTKEIELEKLNVQNIIDSWFKRGKTQQKHLEQRYDQDSRQIDEEHNKKLKEAQSNKNQLIREQEERFRRGIPQRFPDPPRELVPQAEQVEKKVREILNIAIQKNTEVVVTRCEEAQRDLNDLNDSINLFLNKITQYEREKEQFYRDVQREKDRIEKEFQLTKKHLEKDKELALVEARKELGRMERNLEILEKSQNRILKAYDIWIVNLEDELKKQREKTVSLQYSEYKEGESFLIHLPVYGAEFGKGKSGKLKLVGPSIFKEDKKRKFERLGSIEETLSMIQKKMNKATRRQITEILEKNNLLRDPEAVEKLKRGSKTLERLEFMDPSAAQDLVRKYDAHFLC
ncbi:MAG: hypothetical protein ACFFCQ_08835 [Promethearchaeota archaeon]